MADNLSRESRHLNMARIKSKNTKPEEIVRKYLFSRGLRYRRHDKRRAGTPDLLFPKYRTVVFVNGCFWHKHPGCRYFVLPKTNTDFWADKLEKNRLRDERNTGLLLAEGWRVIVVWECELMKHSRGERLPRLYAEIVGGLPDDKSCPDT